jgi:hypothetical protein
MFHLPGNVSGADVQEFRCGNIAGGGVVASWQVWRKPLGKAMLFIMCIGGGGAGSTGNVANGGGGGSSGISRYLYPMWAIPDSLYVFVGGGGIGVTTLNQAGEAGQLSRVSLYQDTAANNLFAVSGAAGAGGGAANGTLGAAGTIATDAGAVFSCFAFTKYIAGMNGTSAVTSNKGGNLAIGTACMIMGGTAAGQAAQPGGDITGVANTPFYTQVQPSSKAGNDGFRFGQFPIIYGAQGGYAGFRGGNGGFPGGGGGGAGGGSTVAGDGGPGLVLMISF